MTPEFALQPSHCMHMNTDTHADTQTYRHTNTSQIHIQFFNEKGEIDMVEKHREVALCSGTKQFATTMEQNSLWFQ